MPDPLDMLHINRRARFFFWLGVFVLPVFWSWFTLAGSFTRRERIIALSWLVLFAVVIIVGWQRLEDYFDLLTIGWPLVIGWLVLPLIPLVLHLWLEPARLGFSRLERKRRVWQLLQFRKARAWWRRHCTFRSRSAKTR